MNPYRHLLSFYELLKTGEFLKGIRFTIAALVPLLVTSMLGDIQVGIAMVLGVLLTSPSDVPGSILRRGVGVAFSTLIAVLATLIVGYSVPHKWIFLPALAAITFIFSMISVYGFRASLIAFSGLFAMVLSMAQVGTTDSVLIHALWIGAGGLWYLLFSLLFHTLLHGRETDHQLKEAFELTARYMEIRAQLMQKLPQEKDDLQKELLGLQTSINEKHEVIRELVISRRRNFGRSGVVRKRLLIFFELVDILELGMTYPLNSEIMNILFEKHEHEIALVQEWNNLMAARLRLLAALFNKSGALPPAHDLQEIKSSVWRSFETLEAEIDVVANPELITAYRNLLIFKEKQHQKLISIERLLKEWEGNLKLRTQHREASRFLTTPEYNIKTIQDNLDLKSPIFRHSLRLSTTMIIGYFVGELFEVQNAYWILLTILVIMRPGYALTRDRFKQRLIGTLIGGAVAVSLVLIIRNQVMYGVLAVISLVLAHSMIQRNYKTAAAFITLNVVFVYSLLRPNALEVIQFRVIDTAVGAGLAFLSAKFLWPTWEYTNISNYINASTKANLEFLKEVSKFYHHKEKLPTSYKLARKKAFLAMGDLNAAFQRMAQEPKTHKKYLEEIFKITSLNQEFLSATASLGTFIRSHETTEISQHFKNYISTIEQNLRASAQVLDLTDVQDYSEDIRLAEKFYEHLYRDLLEEKAAGQGEVRSLLQEAQIIMHQLKWLLEISENLQKSMLPKK